jgi:hypothetical protein
MNARNEDAHNPISQPSEDGAPDDRPTPGSNDLSSGIESENSVSDSKSMSGRSSRNPDERMDQTPSNRLFDRIPGERAGVIIAMLALLVGLGTWLLPHPGSAFCYLTGKRVFDCNDIPEGYLGAWKGQVEMLIGSGRGIDSVTIRRAKKGEHAAEQKAVDWHDSTGQKVGCSHMWELVDAQSDRIRLKTMGPPDSSAVTKTSFCPYNLTMDVRLVDHDTIEITGFTGESAFPLPAGAAEFKGTLHRVTAG